MKPTWVTIFVMPLAAACARGSSDSARTPADSTKPAAGALDTAPRPSVADTHAAPVSTPAAPATGNAPRASGGSTVAAKPPGRRPSGTPPAAPARSEPNAPSLDTVRGIVAVVGAVPITHVVVRPPGGGSITLQGPLAREVGVASGADVVVRGRRTGDRAIEVSGYEVRTVDGVTAITGMLTAEGDRLVLVTDAGRRYPIARPPAPLREHVGARVWVTGDPSTTIASYGVLRPKR